MFAALPGPIVTRMREGTRRAFSGAGIGILAVGGRGGVSVSMSAVRGCPAIDDGLRRWLWKDRDWKPRPVKARARGGDDLVLYGIEITQQFLRRHWLLRRTLLLVGMHMVQICRCDNGLFSVVVASGKSVQPGCVWDENDDERIVRCKAE